MVAGFLKGPADGVDGGDAHASAHAEDPPELLYLGRDAQGTDQVLKRIALAQASQLIGGLAHLLEDQVDPALLRRPVGEGQGKAFARLVDAQDGELTGLRVARDARGFHPYRADGLRESL